MESNKIMETYIIKNKTEMLACNAVKLVEAIMSDGMKAMPGGKEQFPHFTRFDKYIVTSRKNKGEAYSFTITEGL